MTTLFTKLSTVALVAAFTIAPVFALADSGKSKSFAPRSVGSTLEVMISDNGKAVVRGAKVTDVSGSTITAQTMWDASSITWTVRTDGDTDFLRKNGSTVGIDAVAEGDYVSFSGSLMSGSSFTIDADVVKNWSLEESRTMVAGTISDLDADSFTLATAARGEVTVRVNADTDYTGNIDAFADLAVDAKAVAYGSYNPDTKVLTASSVSLSGKVSAEKDKHPNGNAWGFWKKFTGFFGGNR